MYADSNRLVPFAGLLVAVALVLTSCGGGAVAPTSLPAAPTQAPSGGATTPSGGGAAEATTAPAPAGGNLGTADNPIKMAFVPSTDSAKVLASGQQIADLLKKQTGLTFSVSVPTSYAATLEAMGSNQVDVAWLAPVSYVVGRNKVGAELLLTVTRNGSKSYPFEIITQANSSIKSIQDLKGKKFAFTDPLSASGNLYPRAYLLQNSINPDKDMQVTYAGAHDKVVIAVYNGTVDAGAIFGADQARGVPDARNNVVQTFPDVYTKTAVLYNSGPVIPNDTVSVRKGLPDDLKKKIADGLMALAKTEDGLKQFKALYNIDGFVPGNAADYDPILQAAQAANIDLGAALSPPPTAAPKPTVAPTAAATPG